MQQTAEAPAPAAQASTPAVAPAQAAPAAVPIKIATFSQGQVQVIVPGQEAPSPQQVYEAFVAQRSELRDQLSELEDTRQELAERLVNPNTESAIKAGQVLDQWMYSILRTEVLG